MPGPKPLPRKLKQLRGTFRPDRDRGCPDGKPILPQPANWLSAEAKGVHGRLAPVLFEKGLLTEMDLEAFQNLCILAGELARLNRILAEGLTFEIGEKGYRQQAPEFSMRNRVLVEFRKVAAEFGLTPSSRTRIDVPAPEAAPSDEDEWDRFL